MVCDAVLARWKKSTLPHAKVVRYTTHAILLHALWCEIRFEKVLSHPINFIVCGINFRAKIPYMVHLLHCERNLGVYRFYVENRVRLNQSEC